MSRVTAQPWKQKTVFGNRPQLWLEVSCGHRTTKTPHKTRQNNTKKIHVLLSFSSMQHGTSRFRGLENVNRVTHYKTAKKRLASRLAFVIVQKLLGTKGQTSSWFSQTYEKYTNKRAYALQFYRWKHADTAPRSQEDRTIHRIHKSRPLGTAWFRIHENEALTVEGGRGYEPSLKPPNHWTQGVCLHKKVRRSHLKGHNERFSTIVWNFFKGKLFMTPFNIKKPRCLCRHTVQLLCGLVQLRTISSEQLLKPNTIYHETGRKLVLSNFIFVSDLTRTIASHMQIHKVIGSLPRLHQRGFQLKQKYPVSIFMKFSP